MPTTINFNNIRPWGSTQHSGFEELCCQLAAGEKTPAGSKFIRKGTPDGGVECYWKLLNGDEWGWQAKLFLTSLDTTQWKQIDDSVKTALDKHPHLVRYFVCLPIDRADPRIPNQNWFMDKWEAHVATWKTLAASKGMTLDFEYWGCHEITERLTLEEHHGRCLYWFNTESFSKNWYETRLDEALADAGPRYTKDLNVDLPIAKTFEALGRTVGFFKRIEEVFGETKIKWQYVSEDSLQKESESKYYELKQLVSKLLIKLDVARTAYQDNIGWEEIGSLAHQATEKSWEQYRELEKNSRAYNLKTKDIPKDPNIFGPQYPHSIHLVSELISKLNDVKECSCSDDAILSNTPALLIIGEAGTGKTHLFCDVVRKQLISDFPAIILHGMHFSSSEPWSQILGILGLKCTRDEFLGALQAHAEAMNCRALLCIDALNEGDGKTLWKNHLAGMLAVLERFPQIGIAVSVRTSYENSTIPPQLIPNKLTKVAHYGFYGHEYEATEAFFAYYKIERPAIPLLTPEFGRPLFLKIFCEALNKGGNTKVPPGLAGMSAIFDFYLDATNEKLAEALDFDVKDKLIQKSIEKLAEQMAADKTSWLLREKAKEIVDLILPGRTFQTSLYKALLSDGLLIENKRIIDNEDKDVIHFSYERFLDHKICSYLLKRHIQNGQLNQAFNINNPLGLLVKDKSAAWANKGLLEALAIQLPELFSQELPDVIPDAQEWQPVREAVVESFLWRKNSSFSDKTIEYINKVIIQYTDTYAALFDVLFIVAPNPEHPYNSKFLHKNLIVKSMPDRDRDWSMLISSKYGEKEAIDRLLQWAWSSEDKTYLSDESIFLSSVSICWLFSSSNRFLRDAATKALVCLLTPRLQIVRKLINLFQGVNDPYVLERLLAVAYGCVLRSANNTATAEIAEEVYNLVFAHETESPNILIRDYARGIIERAASSGASLSFDLASARPPYKSILPSKIPTEAELEKYSHYSKEMPDAEWSRVHIYTSVIGQEDFARYVIGSDHRARWINRRVGQPHTLTAEEKYNQFVSTLAANEKKALNRYEKSLRNFDITFVDIDGKNVMTLNPEGNKTEGEDAPTEAVAKEELYSCLAPEKKKILDSEVFDYIKNPHKYYGELDLDIKPMQRWLFQRVLDLGWTVEKFGVYDRNLNRHSNDYRTSHKAERIGKKYQWIAYYEMLAFMTDNYELRGDSISDKMAPYSGAWQLNHARNIDPSITIQCTKQSEDGESKATSWWVPLAYKNLDTTPDNLPWIKETADLPDPKGLMEVKNPKDGSVWLVLDTFVKWRTPAPVGEDYYRTKRKQLWYSAESYIIKESDMEKFMGWAKDQNYWGRWMPEAKSQSDLFLGEYYWSPAYNYFNSPYYGMPGWTTGEMGERVPAPILPAIEKYSCPGGGYDCSVQESININLPAKLIVDGLQLKWNGCEGKFFDSAGQLIAFDPSISESGPSSLLIRKEVFCAFLKKNGYAMFWTLLGQKQVLSDSPGWEGDLEISGTYRLDDGKITGNFSTSLKTPHKENFSNEPRIDNKMTE